MRQYTVGIKPIDANRVTAIEVAVINHVCKCGQTERHDISSWYCGITHETGLKLANNEIGKGRLLHWCCWDAGTMKDAQIVLWHMLDTGMGNYKQRGVTRRDLKYVYVFRRLSSTSETDFKQYLKRLFS